MNMDYRIDYGPISLKPSRPSDAPLYASVEGRVASLANQEVLFYDPATDRNHVMTSQVLQAMALCREFQTMERQVQRVTEGVPGLQGQESAVRRVLEGLATRGLLTTDDAFLLRFSRVTPDTLAPPTAIFVRACDRPAQVRQLLQSLQSHMARFGMSYRVVLVDDSNDSAAMRQHAELLRHFGEASGVPVVHVGQHTWRAVASGLATALPEHAAALNALLQRDMDYRGRRGGGIGKNLIGLLAAGERYLLLDDDFQFPLKRHPEYQPGLALDARAWAVRSYADQREALDAGVDEAVDLIEQQLALCGQTVGGALGRVEGFSMTRADLQGMAPSHSAALQPDARITLTVNGHRGAAGASGLAWLYMLDAAGRAQFTASPEVYAATRDDPPVWFGTRRFLLGTGSNFTPFAVDNRCLLPPTSPYGRSEDVLFNALVHLAQGDARMLDAPCSIGHVQEGQRDRSALLKQAETPDINLCFAELARHVATDLYAAEAPPRLALFAARLDDLAGGSDATMLSYLNEFLTYRRSAAVEQLQLVAAGAPDAPDYWKTDLNSLIEANARAVAERAPPRFAGWAEDATSDDCVTAFRREAATLSAGLRAWPAAWSVALEQRDTWLADTTR
jgi:hypothetical protein